ncbi:MAG: AmmeMemoRadiSam system protein B [Patescibacteria group bacterium]|jgi:aromatic ring-opening dioxygenase LigB subunit
MSLVFAGISPHPPILIPNIGKEYLQKIDNTVKALTQMEQDLYASKPDVIVIISPHGVVLLDAFLINLCDKYEINFNDFGDLITKLELRPNLKFIEDLRTLTDKQTPLTVTSEPKLDHGAGVPLYYLTQHLKDISIVPLSYCLLDYAAHVRFGEILKDQIFETNERVAIIASGDLSHRLTKDAPAGYNPKGKEFDKKLIELLKNRDVEGILKLDPQTIEDAGECGLRSILILLGVIKNMNYQTDILSYEGPFGVGYLVANFRFK